MTPGNAPPPRDENEEIAALIKTLHETDQRLEDLMAGEVDAVADRDGRTFLLRRAQDRLRQNEAAKQAALLNALPAHIALLNTRGVIISANEAWLGFAGANAIQRPGYGIGLNYLEICSSAPAHDSSGAHQVAEGIRSVLRGRATRFSLEYSCHSPTEQRWFSLTVTPLASDPPNGVVVMHVDITAQQRAKDVLRESERRFSDMLGNVELVSLMLDREARITYCNEYLLRLTGWRREEVINRDWFELFIPPEVTGMQALYAAQLANLPESRHHENDILTRSGERRFIRWNNSVLRSDAGDVIGTASIGEDITEERRYRALLRQNEGQMRLILQSVGEGIYGIDIGGNIFFKNSATAKMLGYSPGELFGKPSHDTVHYSRKDGTPYPITDCPIHTAMHGGAVRRVDDEVFWRKDGSSFPVEYTIAPMRNDLDNVTGAVVTFRDITDRKEAETKIKRLNRMYAVMSSISSLIVRVSDRGELFKEACRIAVDAGAFKMAWIGIIDPETLNGRVVAWHGVEQAYVDDISLTVHDGTPDSDQPACRALRSMQPVICNDIAGDLSLGQRRDDLLKKGCKSAGYFPLMVEGRRAGVIALFAGETDVFDADELLLLRQLADDISFALDHIEKEKKLHYVAYYDALTGLANRSLFLERMSSYLRSAVIGGHKLALFLIDLERFKNINDNLGQPAGDALLKQVAMWLTRKIGDANLLARVGSDHFAVLLPDAKERGEVARFIEQTMVALQDHPFRLNDAVFRIAAKVGVVLVSDDSDNADVLFKHAEAALKKAKASGDRYLFYTPKMTEAMAGKPTLENRLRQAYDKGEFVLHYQPKVNLVSGKLTGAEALIRWNDPQSGLVPPGQFVPLLEEIGLIHEVGRWALRQATADYLRWRTAGPAAVRIAVNVSPLQLRDRGFIADITQLIGNDAHAAAGLELEITESVIMEDVRHSIASLQAIRAMGIRIAIDDFGTGFSSLSYLSKLPVDTLKIDGSFVNAMPATPQGLALVSTIIDLAHALALQVVAEGVETEEQSRLLRLLKCDEMQGFLISKPVPSDIFEARFLTASPTG